MEALLTKEQVSERLNKTVRAVETMVYRRKIPYTKIGGSVRFPVKALEKWIDKRTIKTA